jgi:hypothetical protein
MPEVPGPAGRAADPAAVLNAPPPGVAVIDARPMSPDEAFYFDLGRDVQRNTVPLLNEHLNRVVVLATALTGGFLGVKDAPLPDPARAAAVALFLLTLGLALKGLMPRRAGYTRTVPAAVAADEARVIEAKAWAVKWSAVALLAGFAAGLAGLLARLAGLA